MSRRPILNVAVLPLMIALCCAQETNQVSQRLSANAFPSAKDSSNSSATAKTSSQDPSFSQRYQRYKLEPGDAFDVAFELNPEFNQHVTVQPDGYITLRGIGDVHVADQTVPELTATLRTAYIKILSDPLVSVVLTDFQRAYFIANGQVKSPGKYELRGDITLAEGIAMAGGFLDSARHSQVLLFRRVDNEWTHASVINLKKMLGDKDLHEDLYLRPGDMLYVPKNRVSKIMPWLPTRNVSAFTSTF
jgi:polysaccharide biosynthesis/export protein